MPDQRSHTTEIEIDATPDQVFRALTEAEQIMRWFAPEARVEPGVGGSYTISWGPGMEGTSKIAVWEPGHRFATTNERTTAYGGTASEGAEPVQIVVDYQIEPAAGGKTLLRLVHSGFGRGKGWDDEFEATRRDWPVFLWILKQALERHPGVDSRTFYVMASSALTPEECWRRLIPAGLAAGSRYAIRLSPAAEATGLVRNADAPQRFIGTAENLNDGLLGVGCGAKSVMLTIVLWGAARDRAAELEAAWKAGLERALA